MYNYDGNRKHRKLKTEMTRQQVASSRVKVIENQILITLRGDICEGTVLLQILYSSHSETSSTGCLRQHVFMLASTMSEKVTR